MFSRCSNRFNPGFNPEIFRASDTADAIADWVE
jgi:hypothetical protein